MKKRINAKEIFLNISKKEKEIETALLNLSPGEISESGRAEMIETVNRMIEKIEALKLKQVEV